MRFAYNMKKKKSQLSCRVILQINSIISFASIQISGHCLWLDSPVLSDLVGNSKDRFSPIKAQLWYSIYVSGDNKQIIQLTSTSKHKLWVPIKIADAGRF